MACVGEGQMKPRKDTVAKFNKLVKELGETRRTTYYYSPRDFGLQPAYVKICKMGKKVIPLVIRELNENPWYWFMAMRIITGENPVKPEDRGKVQKMKKAWLKWADENGYEWR